MSEDRLKIITPAVIKIMLEKANIIAIFFAVSRGLNEINYC